MAGIDVDIGFAKVKPPKHLWVTLGDWLEWHCKNLKLSNAKKKFTSAKELFVQLAKNEVDDIEYYYGDCSICLDDNKEGWIILTPCFHRFHNLCFREKQLDHCPKCEAEVKDFHLLPFVSNSSCKDSSSKFYLF